MALTTLVPGARIEVISDDSYRDEGFRVYKDLPLTNGVGLDGSGVQTNGVGKKDPVTKSCRAGH